MSRIIRAFLKLLELFAKLVKWGTLSVYRILERIAYTLCLILCLVYFALSDPKAAHYVSQAISAALPGSIEIERLYASPLLRYFSFKEVQAFDPEGNQVIYAKNLEAWFNRDKLVPFIRRSFAGERLVLLEFDRIRAKGGWVEVDAREEYTPIERTFNEPIAKPGDLRTDGYLTIKRAQVSNVDVKVRTASADIDFENVEVDADIQLLASDARVRAKSVHITSGEVRLIDQPDLPRFPFKEAHFHRVYNTNDRVEFGGFTLSTSGILITGQGRIGHDQERIIQALIRADTRMDDPLLKELLPENISVSGNGLAAAVARVEGSIEIPVVHLDFYAEDAKINELEIRQFSGQSLLEPETNAAVSWLYTVPRMKIRTQHGTAQISDVNGTYSFREYRGVRGSGDLSFRKFAATRLGYSSGLLSEDQQPKPPDIILNGHVRSDFGYVDGRWRAGTNISMNTTIERKRTVSLRGQSLMTYQSEKLTISPKDLKIEDEHMRVSLMGSATFPDGNADVSIVGNVNSLSQIASPFTDFPAKGQLRQVNLRIHGSLPFPTYEMNCRMANVDAGPIQQIDGRTQIRLEPSGTLFIESLNIDGEAGQARARGSIGLLKRASYQLKEKPVLNFKMLRAKLALHSQFGTQTANGYLNIDSRGLSLDLQNPIASLNGRFEIAGQQLNMRGIRLNSLRLKGNSGAKRIRLKSFFAELERGGAIQGSGQILKRANAVNIDVEGSELNLLALGDFDHKRLKSEDLVQGRINTKMKITGPIGRPRLQGQVEAFDIERQQLALKHAVFQLQPIATGGARIESQVLPEGYLLVAPSELRLEPRRKSIKLTLAIHGADPLDLIKPKEGSAPNYKTEHIKLRGELRAHFSTGRHKKDRRAEVSLTVPPLGFELRSEEFVDIIRNTAPITAEFLNGDLWVPNMQLKMASAHIEGCGVLRKSGDLKLATRGEIPLTMLTTFRTVVSEGEGRALLGGTDASSFPPELKDKCSASLSEAQGSVFTIDGPVQSPTVDGEIRFKKGMLKLTGLPEQIRFPDNWGLLVRTRKDLELSPVEILTHTETTNVLMIGEGAAELSGALQLKGFHPETLDIVVKGQGINFSSTNVSNMTLRTSDDQEPIIVEGRFLSDPEKRSILTRGNIRITDGRYTRSFDALSRTVGGVFGRRMDMFSRPLTETFPVLADMALNMQVTSTSFHVESPFPLGEAKLDLDMNLNVDGTMGKPLMNGLVGIRPKSTITYAFGKGRTFYITQGVIEFQGDTEHPYIELSAESEITYSQPKDGDVTSRNQSLDFEEEESVIVTIRIEGKYPKLDIYFESDRPEFDTADIQSLILVGVPASGDSSNLDPLADTTLNFFTEDLSKALSSLLLTPFIDSVNLGVDQYGGISAEVLAQLGRFLNVRAKIVRVGTDTRYDTGFQVKIREGVYLEGKLKVLQAEEQTQSYEAKLKYRIPLDD